MRTISKDDKEVIFLSPIDVLLRDQRHSTQSVLQSLTDFYCQGPFFPLFSICFATVSLHHLHQIVAEGKKKNKQEEGHDR